MAIIEVINIMNKPVSTFRVFKTALRKPFIQRTALSIGLLFAVATPQANASLVAWELNPLGANTPVGSSSNPYTQSGYTITATGYDNVSGPDTQHGLFFKNAGSDEIGLGLVNTLDNELQINNGVPVNYIQLDLRSILSNGCTN